jgi:hypothetical protein
MLTEHQAAQIAELDEVGCLLNDRDEQFAADLVRKARKYKKISDKQFYWVEKLIDRALNQGEPESPDGVLVGDFAKMVAMFNTAGTKIKYPSLTFMLRNGDDHFKVVIKRAGPKSKYHGELMLTDGGPWGENVWYGRITTEGVWIPSASGEQVKEKLIPFLGSFAANPHSCVSAYGHKTGHCCFCHKGLTHEKSVTVGYGPVCADNWGLKDEWNQALKES